MGNIIRSIDQLTAEQLSIAGGKGGSLARLYQLPEAKVDRWPGSIKRAFRCRMALSSRPQLLPMGT
jgi:hypothetical protein